MLQDFSDLQPYSDVDVSVVIPRIVHSPYLPAISSYLFPGKSVEELQTNLSDCKSILDFQTKVMYPAIRSIITKTSAGLSSSGFEMLKDGRSRMFVSNHRDIMLDAAILQILLSENGLDTSEITFGSNLMQGELVIDIGKMNKMFRIMRKGMMKDFYQNSIRVSSYMRYVLLEKKQSVWIAQRNGRTKDGADQTDMAVLKMFALGSQKEFYENMKELNITPIVISYEYEPCDFLKTQEAFISRYQSYEKEPGEDLNSILSGIRQRKGHIHFAVTEMISEEELHACNQLDRNKKFQQLAKIIDRRIYSNYRLWPTNYIAYDILYQSYKYREFYTEAEKSDFLVYMNEGLKGLVGDESELRDIFLEIYANPVINVKELH